MSIYAHIKRCLELSDRDIASAVADRRLAKALLDQLAKVSRAGDGAPKLLLVFAKMASSGVDWIDGALRVEMVGDADVTVVEVLSELGLGMHERVFPSFKMAVPLDEFARAVERVPHMVAPLTIATKSARRLVLTAIVDEEEEGEEASPAAPAPAVSIGDDSLYTGAAHRRSSKDTLAAVKDPGTRIQPRTTSSGKLRSIRKNSRPPGAEARPKVIAPNTGKTLRPMAPPAESPASAPASAPRIAPAPPPIPASAARIAQAPSVPRAPPLPRTDERTPAPGPAPGPKRAVVARVPLTKMHVPASSHAKKQPSKPPKRVSVKPPPKAPPPSRPSGRPSKGPPPRSLPPKSNRARPKVSEPPDEEAIDTGWDDKE